MHVRQQAEMPFLTDRELCASIAGIVGLPWGAGAEAAWVEAAVKTREICRLKRLNRCYSDMCFPGICVPPNSYP